MDSWDCISVGLDKLALDSSTEMTGQSYKSIFRQIFALRVEWCQVAAKSVVLLDG